MKQVIYLHGFNSSPQAHKAACLREALKDRQDIKFDAPDLYHHTEQALMALAAEIAGSDDQFCLIGSSLGGYFATYLSEKFDLKAVLINPVIRPYTFNHLIGQHVHSQTGEQFEVTAADLARLQLLDVEKISRPQNFLLLLQTGDETLDYRLALDKFTGSKEIVEQGGSHEFDGFDRMLPAIFNFFDLTLEQ